MKLLKVVAILVLFILIILGINLVLENMATWNIVNVLVGVSIGIMLFFALTTCFRRG